MALKVRRVVAYDPPRSPDNGGTVADVHAWLSELLAAGVDPATRCDWPSTIVVSFTEEVLGG